MIGRLLNHITEILRHELGGDIRNPAKHIVPGPVADPATTALPVIALTPGVLEIPSGTRDASSSQPRPQPFTEEIRVKPDHPHGPYALAKTPLSASVQCNLILDKDKLDERRCLLSEGSDFTVDYQQARITFHADIAKAGSILLRYSFVGVYTVQNFSQDFLIEVYDSTHALTEKWLSLGLSAVLTYHDELLEHYNTTDKTVYGAGVLGTAHQLAQIRSTGCVPAKSKNICWQLSFKASGQLMLTRTVTDGFNLLERIRSPGKHSGQAIDIDVGLQ